MSKLPENGYVKLRDILGDPKASPPIPAIVPVCKATWFAGQRLGRFPMPVRIGDGRGTFYRADDIRKLLASV